MVIDLPIIDPLLSIMLSLFILWNVIRNLKVSFGYFLQQVPDSFDSEEFTQELNKLEGVLGSHHTHCWTLEGEHHVFSTHLVMQSSTSLDAIYQTKLEILALLGDEPFEHITIEVELEGEKCLLECSKN